jgi:hypothetical protein
MPSRPRPITLSQGTNSERPGTLTRQVPEPDTVADTRTAVTTRTAVSAFCRVGVSHTGLFATSHARSPLAPPTAAAAVAMHWAHIALSMTKRRMPRPTVGLTDR